MPELVIRGATVYDGSGGPGVQQDVAVRDDRIVAIGADASLVGADRIIDAGGLALAPGFIDMHSHADHTLPAFPLARNSITQGVTTELVGLCGFSVAPLSPEPRRAEQLRELARGIGPDLDWGWTSTCWSAASSPSSTAALCGSTSATSSAPPAER